jgi:hypothetical protein
MDFGRAVRTVFQIFSVSVLTAACLVAQNELPGVDLSGLNAAQKATVLKLTHEQGCSC